VITFEAEVGDADILFDANGNFIKKNVELEKKKEEKKK